MNILISVILFLVCLAVMAWAYRSIRKEINRKISAESVKRMDALREYNESMKPVIAKLQKSIEDLSNGIIPDFEKAKDAVNSMNDFYSGLSAILGYDPQKQVKRGDEE